MACSILPTSSWCSLGHMVSNRGPKRCPKWVNLGVPTPPKQRDLDPNWVHSEDLQTAFTDKSPPQKGLNMVSNRSIEVLDLKI